MDVPSRIHTCYTGISSWLTKSVAGIRSDPEHPGYQSFIIKPLPGGDLSFAEASTESPYGRIASRWEKNGKILRLSVTIPANSQATVFFPTSNAASLTEAGTPVSKSQGVTLLRMEGNHAVLKVESGTYQFQSGVD